MIGAVGEPDVLEVTPAQGALILHAPEQVTPGHWLAVNEVIDEADAVERIARIRLRAGEFEEGGRPVHCDDRLVVNLLSAHLPGQLRMVGTRMPPSSTSPLPPDNGQLYEKRSPPLSLAKKTTVSSRWPPRRRADRTFPIDLSRSSTIAW
jgi:hypothetical protein